MTEYTKYSRKEQERRGGAFTTCMCEDFEIHHDKNGCKLCSCEEYDWKGNHVEDY